MATTSNFGWTTPDDTALVKDGASAIRSLGTAIDTSLVDLKGGVTGQVLSKASSADMDLTWVAPAGARMLIESKSLTGTSIAFTSIPSQYRDLYLVVEGATMDFDETNVDVRVNNNSSSIYVRGKNDYTESLIFFCSTDSTESLANIRFQDYNSSNYKFVEYTSITLNVEPETPREYFIDGLSSYAIMATAAITSIQILAGATYDYTLGGELVDEGAVFTGGTAYLYGVA